MRRLLKDVLAIVFNGLAEVCDRIAVACEDKPATSPEPTLGISLNGSGAIELKERPHETT